MNTPMADIILSKKQWPKQYITPGRSNESMKNLLESVVRDLMFVVCG